MTTLLPEEEDDDDDDDNDKRFVLRIIFLISRVFLLFCSRELRDYSNIPGSRRKTCFSKTCF